MTESKFFIATFIIFFVYIWTYDPTKVERALHHYATHPFFSQWESFLNIDLHFLPLSRCSCISLHRIINVRFWFTYWLRTYCMLYCTNVVLYSTLEHYSNTPCLLSRASRQFIFCSRPDGNNIGLQLPLLQQLLLRLQPEDTVQQFSTINCRLINIITFNNVSCSLLSSWWVLSLVIHPQTLCLSYNYKLFIVLIWIWHQISIRE